MSFSASTCLTNSGTTPLGGLFDIYSNVDQFFNAFQSNVTYSQLFGGNCPYIMGNVPDGTTSIKIIDRLTKCCVTIDVNSNDLCETCELGFDDYETNTIGVIVAGELTGSCQNVISDYRIFWYGPDNPNQLAFTSGYGSEFSPYDNTHPITNLMQPAGNYIPVIDKVKLDGLNFSQTGGTGYIQAELECFNATTVNVEPFRCDNGTEVGDYTHRVNFTGAAVGVTPLTLNSTFELSATTNYFAWKFNGFAVSDTLKITFSGSSYDEPLILEYWTIGTGSTLTSDINILTIPKSGRTSTWDTPDPSYFFKVTSLTSLTINPGDYLILEVIPNQSNSQTNWDFYFTCLDTFDCSLCLDSYLNTPYKIKTTSIKNTAFGGCGQRNITFDLSGCSFNQIYSSDLWKYSMGATSAAINQFVNTNTNNTTNLLQRQTTVSTGTTSCGLSLYFNTNLVCAEPPNNNTIIFQKTIVSGEGKINMVFSDLNDLIVYKNSYESIKATSGYNPDPTNINYYQYTTLSIQSSTGNQECGDTTSSTFYDIHFSSVITTGGTPGNWSLTMPMPTITKQINFTTCQQGCNDTLINIVNTINTSSTSTSNNLIRETNKGQRYTVPFYRAWRATLNINNPSSGSTAQGYYLFYNSYNLTIPFSGNSSPYTPITSLSAQTCDFSTKGITQNPGNQQSQYQRVYVYDYDIRLTNYPDLTSYTIKANPIVNGVRTATNYPDTVVTVVNGSIIGIPNPLYTF